MVWNPLYEPRTVKVHVDLLRKQSSDPYVWWGRIYAGSSKMDRRTLKEKWDYVFKLEKQARKDRRQLVVFVTDYQSLHALRVDRIKLGPSMPEEPGDRIPDYYREDGRKVGLWFQVRDVRALTHYQLRTLEYFREMLGPVRDSFALGNRLSYDPYAAFKYDYPVVVEADTADRLFDRRELAQYSKSAKLFAELPETVFPPDLQTILSELEEELAFIWNDLRDNSRIFLACARLVEKRYASLNNFDFSAAFCEVAKAMETELIDGLLSKLFQIPAAIWEHEAISENSRLPVHARNRSLGGATATLRHLGLSEPPASLAALTALSGPDASWIRWLEQFTKLRNLALHRGVVSYDDYWKAWRETLDEGGKTGILPVVRLEAEVRTLLSSRATPPSPLS